MHTQAIEELFQHYIVAFQQQEMSAVKQCYQLPCTLHTPDKAVLITNDKTFTEEFLDIFTVLSHAKISHFLPLKSSFSQLKDDVILACVDWQFIGPNEEVFTDFSAFYHLVLTTGQWRIFNVVSQELSQSIDLETPFKIAYK